MESFLALLAEYRYSVLFLALMGETLGLPLPAEPTLLVAGALVASGVMQISFALPLALAGILAGDTLIYLLGKSVGMRRGERAIEWYCRWARCTLGSEHCYARARGALSRFRVASLIWVKFIVGVRIFAPPLAGLTGTKYIPFVLYDGLGSLLWAGCFIGAGYYLKRNFIPIESSMASAGTLTFILVLAGFLALTLYKLHKRMRHGAARVVIPFDSPSDEDAS